jgi:hypothetical protein
LNGRILRGDLCRALPALNRPRPIARPPIDKTRSVQPTCIILWVYPLPPNPKQWLHFDGGGRIFLANRRALLAGQALLHAHP